MPAPVTLRLGTRPSLLAVAQSHLVARELERLHPHVTVDLVRVATRGDRDQTTPLSHVNDPGFFATELDAALVAGDVDFCVHSYKDLQRGRPGEIALAAVPPRENPRDVVIFGAEAYAKLKRGECLTIGSSSARRQVNVGDFLPHALPHFSQPPKLEFQPLRGPVHERVARLSPAAGRTQLDGVVLALAGLARLWQDSAGRQAIEPLLANVRWMVLPLRECPTAVGQGALAIECRAADQATLTLLARLHDPASAAQLATETAALENYARDDGASCGATSIAVPELGIVTHVRGRRAADQREISKVMSSATPAHQPSSAKDAKLWTGSEWATLSRRTALVNKLPASGAVFAAHWHALDNASLNPAVRCWTSGPESWRQLARQGIWVEGCADNLGFDAVKATLQSAVLALPALDKWTALTHSDATHGWRNSGVRHALATYAVAIDTNNATQNSTLQDYTHFYWSSARQYTSLRDWLPENAEHACGPGKTLTALREIGLVNVQAFTSRQEWQQWLT